MAARIRDKVFEAPLHVMPGDDGPGSNGCVRVLLPDGHSLTLSIEAAERSALLLARAAVRTREENAAHGKPGKSGLPRAAAKVIAVDFVHHARLG